MVGTTRTLTLSPVHLLRVGDGPDAVRIEARGRGVIVGSFGLLRVHGALKVVRTARLPAGRGWALFFGFHGAAFARVQLAPTTPTSTPAIEALRAPLIPRAVSVERVGVELTVQPPELP